MSAYTINDLEKLSGIKAHTIRMWEQRYNLLKPMRSEGNQRSYDDNEMRKFLNISTLINDGAKISKVSKLSESEINSHIEAIITNSESKDIQINASINQLILAGINYNEVLFEKAFTNAVLKFGLKEAYQNVIYPMLVKIGLMWGKSDMIPTQEHFLINLIKQKLYTAIEQIPAPSQPKETWLLFLPEEEDHELGLLLSNYLIRSSNNKVIHLGQRVPYSNLKAVIDHVKPDYLQYFIVRQLPSDDLQELVNKMKTDFPKIKKCICASSYTISSIKLPKDHIWVSSINDLTKLLTIKE